MFVLPQGSLSSVNGVVVSQGGSARLSRDIMKRREHWLKSIIQWQTEFLDSLSAQEFVDGITRDLLGRVVFVFTPSGELLHLPKVSILSCWRLSSGQTLQAKSDLLSSDSHEGFYYHIQKIHVLWPFALHLCHCFNAFSCSRVLSDPIIIAGYDYED